ncbi:uncharacterized protein Tco025E_03902 [Trypanosoma conorhini]|uniref:Uncharacterized protein n=1 Tax=Trypanosoma conorhini TaxID=83891 RepID=A0A422PR27_9TRYP|nr:uncharacterized protein Tco025E_03902 [Trypanosoma conorhini]RNF20200.1 hypothetical protein Tco025E_03902 [Trypanosoma conorhini]
MSSKWLPDFVLQRGRESTSYSSTRGKVSNPFDLVTEDACIITLERTCRHRTKVLAVRERIHKKFRGFADNVESEFVLKSSLTQVGVNAENIEVTLDRHALRAEIRMDLVALAPLAVLMLDYILQGAYIGKLFAVEGVRRVRDVSYINRLLYALDQAGNFLLNYGDSAEPNWELKVVDGRVVAFLPILDGTFAYNGEVHGLLPTIGAALSKRTRYKELLRLHQEFRPNHTRVATAGGILLVRGYALHLRTLFGRVVDEFLPPGLKSMSSRVIEPDSSSSQKLRERTFVFHGDSTVELTHVPIEFFTLESYREHVPFSLRKTLSQRCASKADILSVFKTAPKGSECCCTYICKGGQFNELTSEDWVSADPKLLPYVGYDDPERQQELAQQAVYQECEYSILSAIAAGDITSDGVLLTRYFPSPCLKSLILSCTVGRKVRAIFFARASRHHGEFFSQEDSGLLCDLNTFGIAVFYVDEAHGDIYQFIRRQDRDSGVFVPVERRQEYLLATFFGVYGSNMVEGDFEAELGFLLNCILQLRHYCNHPLLNPNKTLALVTGGGPGAMEVGNRVAKSLGILSCGLFVDFGTLSHSPGATINEQKKNPYIDAFMTYRSNKLVERQSDFNLDFPIFLTGGIGTDFEYALEEVRRKVGAVPPNPILLFGSVGEYTNKITGRYRENLRAGTIKGSEWICSVPWLVTTGAEACEVYRRFFNGQLPVGPKAPLNDRGFVLASEYFAEHSM